MLYEVDEAAHIFAPETLKLIREGKYDQIENYVYIY